METSANVLQEKLMESQKVLKYLNGASNSVVFERKREWGGADLKLNLNDVYLYHIDEVTFEEKAPRREAMENILATFREISGFNFVYMILGDKTKVDFYFGIVVDKLCAPNDLFRSDDIAKHILKPSIKGNYRGSRITLLESDQKKEVLDRISNAKRFGVLEGIPGASEESDKNNGSFQSIERLIDVMLGENFGFIVLAQPCSYNDVDQMKSDLFAVYDLLVPLTKYTVQSTEAIMKSTNSTGSFSKSTQESQAIQSSESNNHSETDSINKDYRSDKNNQIQASESEGINLNFDQTTDRHSHTKSDGGSTSSNSNSSESSTGMSKSTNKNTGNSYCNTYSESNSNSTNVTKSKSWSDNESTSNTTCYSENWSKNDSEASSNNLSTNKQVEVGNKSAAYWVEYIEKILLPRLDSGLGKGIFRTCIYMFSEKNAQLYRLANTAMSLFSAEKGNQNPLRFYPLGEEHHTDCIKLLKNLQIPVALKDNTIESRYDVALSKCVSDETVHLANWASANEVTVVAGLPQKDVVGLSLRKEVDFGLNINNKVEESNRIKLGNLVQCGDEKEIPFYLDKGNLDKHIFVAGVTGSGKTTTCQNILLDCNLPFLVIEPAKTEYRILKQQCSDLIVFTPGRQDIAPFYLNPFELFPGEAITSRADMLKATMEASFDMDAAIPQLLEAAIYKVYEDKGWNIGDNTWNGKSCEEACADGVYAFPTLSDFVKAATTLVDEQGFDERLRDAYKGSIKARLQGLLVGAKGMMLNTYRSVDFSELVERKVVIELEEIRNGTEKSLLMGFILTNLLEALKYKHRMNPEFQHITLVEEAHRLLSNYSPGDSMNKKQGVEVFADMLAEVRKYRESLIIVDQIPNKMTPEVLKNTNTKIVHKLFAQDDKEAIGNTMALEKEQKEFLSNLVPGRAVVFTQGLTKAIQVQVTEKTHTTGVPEVNPQEIRDLAVNYYYNCRKRGVLRGLEHLENATLDDVKKYLALQCSDKMVEFYRESRQSNGNNNNSNEVKKQIDYVKVMDNLKNFVKRSVKMGSMEFFKKYFYWNTHTKFNKTLYDDCSCFIEAAYGDNMSNEELAFYWKSEVVGGNDKNEYSLF